jgi:hypothetical protein
MRGSSVSSTRASVNSQVNRKECIKVSTPLLTRYAHRFIASRKNK